jgi:ABC-type uncharacterized transport system YnjBCD permease subunit
MTQRVLLKRIDLFVWVVMHFFVGLLLFAVGGIQGMTGSRENWVILLFAPICLPILGFVEGLVFNFVLAMAGGWGLEVEVVQVPQDDEGKPSKVIGPDETDADLMDGGKGAP